MKIRPEQWTHHHTHRLFHISLGLCFGFISIVLVGGMISALFGVSADDSSPKSGDIAVTALVEGVNPGPIGSGSTGGSTPVPTTNPTVTIVAEPQGQIPARGNAYVFPTSKPSFSGQSSVPNGLVFLTIQGQTILNSTAQAGADGKWFWQSPLGLPEGNYTIVAAVFDSYDLTRSGSAKVNFIIELVKNQPQNNQNNNSGSGKPSNPNTPTIPTIPINPPSGPQADTIFGVFLNVLPQYKTVFATQKVVTGVSLVSNTGKEFVNQDVVFKVISPSGKVILQTTDTVSFSKHSDYLKTFYIAPATPEGEYTILVSAVYKGIASVASDTFTVQKISQPVVVGQTNTFTEWPWLIWILLLLLLLMFIILTIMAYHQVRHHTKELNAQS